MPDYVIDTRHDEGTDQTVYRVWRVVPGDPEDDLLGEYDSLASAKASVTAAWRDPDREDHEAWGFREEEAVPEPRTDEEFGHR